MTCSVGKLTLQRKELCFMGNTEMRVMLLTDANPGNVFHFVDDSAVWCGREGGRGTAKAITGEL